MQTVEGLTVCDLVFENGSNGQSTEGSLDLARHNVPRYLFRAWSDQSGGGQCGLNTASGVIPHAFVIAGQGHRSVHDIPRQELREMLLEHLDTQHTSRSEFSSWAASLLLVLCYCSRKSVQGETGIHVAVIDTHILDPQIAAWHVPQLLQVLGYPGQYKHEYLAHGPIAGAGYKAVAFTDLLANDLFSVFPEMHSSPDAFGHILRDELFLGNRTAVPTTLNEIHIVGRISRLFGSLALPVAAALLSLRPRAWIEPIVCSSEVISQIVVGLGRPEVPQEWFHESWLFGTDQVDTSYGDIKQWINLLRALAEERWGRGARHRQNDRQGRV